LNHHATRLLSIATYLFGLIQSSVYIYPTISTLDTIDSSHFLPTRLSILLPRFLTSAYNHQMSNSTALYRQFLQTLSRVPKTTANEDLKKLAESQGELSNEAKLLSEADLVKRERLVKEYEDEYKKSAKQSQYVFGQAPRGLYRCVTAWLDAYRPLDVLLRL
jgi:hypothetical protein